MSAIQAIVPRLSAGRPLLLSGDPCASLRAEGWDSDEPTLLGRMLRESASLVSDLYEREVDAGVDVIGALTTQTTPRSLAAIGMAFRAAALTSLAVDLALEVAERQARPIVVAGVLGGERAACGRGVDRLAEELAMHAARLAAAGCGLLIARGERAFDEHAKLVRTAAIASAVATGLPTWAVLHVGPDGLSSGVDSVEDAARGAVVAGASALLLEVDAVDAGAEALGRLGSLAARDGVPLGVLLGAMDPLVDRAQVDRAAWAEGAALLVAAGARILGGGRGTTPKHLGAVAQILGRQAVAS